MIVKIDTKEKFHVVTPQEHTLSVNMTDELNHLLLSCLEKDVKNVILNMTEVTEMDETVAEMLLNSQQMFYDQKVSFVICGLKPDLENWLDTKEILELMNVTPTESEAWDIVQMEEIEREMFED
jgi:anti-anti-sigma factor